MSKQTNHLAGQTSPYLLQHVYNPVEWYPWGNEALERAHRENKPILVSIGYAACHWCHVMERESFEHTDTAAYMNAHFVNIKIDREERPDLDHIYMDAVQAMTGSGGWPLNVFLTPDLKPFYGGTYYPPQRVHNRPSWTEVLQGVASAYKERREEIETQASNLTTHLLNANSFGLKTDNKPADLLQSAQNKTACEALLQQADSEWGGFGRAPKFPQTFSIQYLLRYYHQSRIDAKGMQEDLPEEAKAGLQQALLSLDKMIAGGIYDQLGGGFARYSTDTEWLAPHFEKMLYDNALLVSVISEAYQLTGNEKYRQVLAETIGFVERELYHPEGAFLAALDADSEGVEGKFYVWDTVEVEECLGADALAFCRYYDISPQGNWEGHSILRVQESLDTVAAELQISPEQLREVIQSGKEKLLDRRSGRVRPQLDDKVLLGWNALMNTACCKAYAATGESHYRDLAVKNMEFLEKYLKAQPGGFHHTWKMGRATVPAFLDDYAYLIQSLLHLQEITGQTGWLEQAAALTEYVLEHFAEETGPFFYYTPARQPAIIVRKKEVYDGATPSGNAIMAENMYRLSILLDRAAWREQAIAMVTALGQAIVRYPTSFGCWNNLLLEMVAGTAEVAILGTGYEELRGKILRIFSPYKVLMATDKSNDTFPLLAGKTAGEPALIYVCRDYACQQPVTSSEAAISLINRGAKHN
ncbi:MAG: thioredoxin domain-containing protein [Chitinophagaceae bacterium]